MQKNHTNEIDLGNVKTDKLLKLLKKVEQADNAQEAIWLPEGDREVIAEIRSDIEDQTGR